MKKHNKIFESANKVESLKAQLTALEDEVEQLEIEFDEYCLLCEENGEMAKYTDKYEEYENKISEKNKLLDELTDAYYAAKDEADEEERDMVIADENIEDSIESDDNDEKYDCINNPLAKRYLMGHKLVIINTEYNNAVILADYYDINLLQGKEPKIITEWIRSFLMYMFNDVKTVLNDSPNYLGISNAIFLFKNEDDVNLLRNIAYKVMTVNDIKVEENSGLYKVEETMLFIKHKLDIFNKLFKISLDDSWKDLNMKKIKGIKSFTDKDDENIDAVNLPGMEALIKALGKEIEKFK